MVEEIHLLLQTWFESRLLPLHLRQNLIQGDVMHTLEIKPSGQIGQGLLGLQWSLGVQSCKPMGNFSVKDFQSWCLLSQPGAEQGFWGFQRWACSPSSCFKHLSLLVDVALCALQHAGISVKLPKALIISLKMQGKRDWGLCGTQVRQQLPATIILPNLVIVHHFHKASVSSDK